jgi:tetratricopeptide (TPR) repeat protein
LARGRTQEAIAEMQHARELEPASGPVQAMLAYTFYLSRQYGPALEWVEKSLDLDFRFPMAHAVAGQIQLQMQGCERAVAHFSHACQLSGENAQACALLGYGHALAGDDGAARAILSDLQARSRTSYVPGYFLALVHIGLGQHQQALDCLTLACRERCQHRLLLGLDPKLDPLRGYGRFGELIAACALGECATARAIA